MTQIKPLSSMETPRFADVATFFRLPVVKDLNKNTDIIADQSYSERQLFEKAYERLKSEFEAVLKSSPDDVKKKMDKALGKTAIAET